MPQNLSTWLVHGPISEIIHFIIKRVIHKPWGQILKYFSPLFPFVVTFTLRAYEINLPLNCPRGLWMTTKSLHLFDEAHKSFFITLKQTHQFALIMALWWIYGWKGRSLIIMIHNPEVQNWWHRAIINDKQIKSIGSLTYTYLLSIKFIGNLMEIRGKYRRRRWTLNSLIQGSFYRA